MYTEYFGLKDNPFSIAPDPAYFYISDKHREALAHLMYAFNSDGGFVLLTGEVGTGKTTVCRRLLEQVPEDCDIAFILYPKLTGEELLATICDEFGIDNPGDTASSRVLVARIYDYLVRTHEQGRRAVLIVEEAQNLSDDVLEQIRLLTNLETNKRKLLQIIMIGQPELQGRLLRPELRQLSQRITARYHLTPLSYRDMSKYIKHRLTVAGMPHSRLFPPPVLRGLFQLTRGVPRMINVICDRALTGAYVQAKDHVDKKTLRAAAREVSGHGPRSLSFMKAPVLLFASFAFLCVVFAVFYYGRTLTRVPAPVLAKPQESGRQVIPEVSGQSDQRVGTGAAIEARPANLDPPGDQVGALTKERAFTTLLGRWHIDLQARTTPQVCARIGTHGLACLEGRDSLDGLRRINRPAVLRLNDEKSGDYYVVLTSLATQTATTVIGDETRVVDIKELGRKWSGEYALFWRLPPGYSEGIKRGDKGPYVVWIAQRLSDAEGRGANPDSGQVFTDNMAKQIRQFQIAAGLTPDGLIGPKTLIRLSDGSGNNEPTLDSTQGGR
jgi:general secretion pathway protein A